MLTELCAELKNYFLRDRDADIHYGEYTISGGSIDLPFLLDGQYFRIVGSVLNDGVYQYPVSGLADEEFTGAVWAMAVPPHILKLDSDNDELTEKVEELSLVEKGFASEAFGGYSYSLLSGAPPMLIEKQKSIERRIRKYRRLSVL